MAWLILIFAGLFEVVGVLGLKRVAEKGNVWNYVILIGGFLLSFSLLIEAMETIPLATSYAVWTGIGTVGAALMGMIVFRESKSLLRIACILGVIFAVIGLKFVG